MKIAVYGAGSMGMVLGALMTKGGLDVTLIDAYAPHVEAMAQKGAHITGKIDVTIPVKAITPDQMEGTYDLVLLMTKQTANEEAAEQLLPHLGKDSVVCTLQNGVPELAVGKLFGPERTVGGIMMWSAGLVGPGESMLNTTLDDEAYPLFEIGEVDGRITPRIQTVAKALECMGKVIITENLMGARWFKVMVNSTISGMSTALGITFYQALREDPFRSYSAFVARECGRVCKAAGIQMTPFQGEDPAEICDFDTPEGMARFQNMITTIIPGDNKTGVASMLMDLKNGKKKTEIDMINGFVTQQGDRLGIDTPFNDAIVSIVKDIEAGRATYCQENLKRFPAPEL